jgi:hypothetical protein
MRAATRPGIDKDIVLGLREIARQTRLIRSAYPTLSNNDVFSVINWHAGQAVEGARMLRRIHRQRTGFVDLRLYPATHWGKSQDT